jgi:RimJ/RimL family protein N-acetyltransferase
VRPVLTTPRLRLEPLGPRHAEHLVALDGDAEVMRHLTGRARSREEVLTEWLPVLSRETGPGGVLGYWAGLARDTDTGLDTGPDTGLDTGLDGDRFVGWWALNPSPDDGREAELGYRLRRSAWGRGLATEGARAVLDHGFAAAGLERVWAQTMAVNLASRGVMERLGMRFARTWVGEWNEPLPGWEQGEVEYAVTREEWLASRDRHFVD